MLDLDLTETGQSADHLAAKLLAYCNRQHATARKMIEMAERDGDQGGVRYYSGHAMAIAQFHGEVAAALDECRVEQQQKQSA